MKREVREDQHGTITGYTYGCRCRECRASGANYRANLKASGMGGPDDPRHGTAHGYSRLRCRCEPCVDAYGALRHKVTEDVTQGTVRQWGMSLGLPIKSHGVLPQGLIDRWNREHPDRTYSGR